MNEKELLTKPLWQMTGQEFCLLFKYAFEQCAVHQDGGSPRLTGIAALAEYLGCSEAQVYKMKKAGVFDSAIAAHVGKTYVFLAEEAQRCANAYQKSQEE